MWEECIVSLSITSAPGVQVNDLSPPMQLLGLAHTCRQNTQLSIDKSPILSVDCRRTNPTWSGTFCHASTLATCRWTIAELCLLTRVPDFIYKCVLSLTPIENKKCAKYDSLRPIGTAKQTRRRCFLFTDKRVGGKWVLLFLFLENFQLIFKNFDNISCNFL